MLLHLKAHDGDLLLITEPAHAQLWCLHPAYSLTCEPGLKFKFQVLFVTYTTIQRLYNQQWNESRVRSMDSANIEKTTQGK